MSDRRRERRAAERAARKRRDREPPPIPVMMVGDGILGAELPGHQYEARGGAKLPDKQPGAHRWIATASWVITEPTAAAAHDVDTIKVMDHENLMYLGIGCWDCEAPLGVIEVGSVCPAEADDG